MIEQYDLFEKHNQNGSTQSIIHGDCLQFMAGLPDDHIDFCVTDPPYGLHFMGKNWDSEIPNILIWKQLLRILKPGSMLAAFGGSRTHHHLMSALEQAGFEIRDCIMWLYGSGFPKSHNNFGLSGYGTALKPAYEPIILAMKPLDGTYRYNCIRWGLAGINIDECRIPSELPENRQNHGGGTSIFKGLNLDYKHKMPSGRWPSNVILSEEAAQILDQQSGILKSGDHHGLMGKMGYQGGIKQFSDRQGDSGGASRFFYCAKASSGERNKGLEGLPLKDPETKYGCTTPGNNFPKHGEPRKNTHPTVKPIALMKYIIKLLAPPNNSTLIDPFLGSGTTLLACKEMSINAIGIEKELEYVNIAKKRLQSW